MERRARKQQAGQAIVIVALMIVVLFGFVGLAIDGGRGYLDRRQMQRSVDGAALAAAYNYMNNQDYALAEQAATNEYALNEDLYMTPTCSGYGTLSATCRFADPTGHQLTIVVVNHSIAGVTFTATATHHIQATLMQVLGAGAMPVGATATAVARKPGTNGAAIQTLSPGGCPSTGGTNSLTFQGNSTTTVSGDVWSNGVIFDNSNANGGSINGNVVGICPSSPFLTTPAPWTVSGQQANGFDIPDPNYPVPPLNSTPQTWIATSGSVEQPGTYSQNPQISGGKPCYFLDAGVYTFAAGLTDNAGFMSNELRPPGEPDIASPGQPNMTTTTSALSGSISSIAVSSLPGAVPASTIVWVGGQQFTVGAAGAAASAGPTSIPLANNQSANPAIASGSTLTVRAMPQFWDSNGVGCGSSFTVTPNGSGNFSQGTYSVEVTAVRWESTAGGTCSATSPTCYQRESAPSMCKTVVLSSSGVIKVAVTADPGAQDFNVYLAPNGSCSGLTYCTDTGNGNSSVNINTCPPGQPSPPDQEGVPIAAGLPNADAPAGAPPGGDLANERECVNPGTGSYATCPTGWTPGAVAFFIPSTGCLDTHGGKADMYLFSGYQYSRVLLFEPGPEQSSSPNTCSNFINGNGFTSLLGVVYAPAAAVTINGNTTYQATIAGGVIAWTAAITGSGGVAIYADPTLRTWPSTVRLTQ